MGNQQEAAMWPYLMKLSTKTHRRARDTGQPRSLKKSRGKFEETTSTGKIVSLGLPTSQEAGRSDHIMAWVKKGLHQSDAWHRSTGGGDG